MNSSVFIAIISLLGTITGSLIGALSMSKLVNFRLDLLDRKVDDLSNLLERMSIAEHKINEIDNYVKDNCE